MATAEIKSKELKDFVKIKVRFSEVDSIRVVWHGSYVAYLAKTDEKRSADDTDSDITTCSKPV
jgi:acyl-CoA thioesterase FadM